METFTLSLQTGIEEGYLDRPCLEPLDPHCPVKASNHYKACDAIQHLNKHLVGRNKTLAIELAPYVVKGDSEEEGTSVFDMLAAFCNTETIPLQNFSCNASIFKGSLRKKKTKSPSRMHSARRIASHSSPG